MYKYYTADDWRKHIKLQADYNIDGFLIFGTFQKYPYEMLKETLERMDVKPEYYRSEQELLEPIQQFTINNKRFWFVVAYGGALLSEYLHLACMFGSKKNILLGSCGGLKHGAKSSELIVPDWSYAEESSARAYQPDSQNMYRADELLSDRLAVKLAKEHTVYRGSTVTYQAMMGETWDDVTTWSQQGHSGVEMEAATVFATSNHFKVASAAILQIGDNLIEEETTLHPDYNDALDLRRKVSGDSFEAALKELLS